MTRATDTGDQAASTDATADDGPEQSTCNGIDVAQLFDTMKLLRAQPQFGHVRFRARNRWVGGQHNRTVLKDFYAGGQEDRSRREPFILDAGEPPIMAGANEGPDPAEVLLHCLAASLTTTLVYVAAAQGIELTDVQSTVEGDLDLRGALGLAPEVRNGYDCLRVSFKVKANASEEAVREVIDLVQSRSVVFDTLSRGVPITIEVAR